ncbi:MAG TPA: hypothetical protein PK883_02100 [Anaerolineaceae bacterium]|nr:hypothetical protein [Anaerolineaceae bacterium]
MDLILRNMLHQALRNILIDRCEVLKLACEQRSKFEGWLKFELAFALSNCSDTSELVLEDSYPSNGRSDFSFVYKNEKYFVEMKTANTNWRVAGVENLHRPVTKNISGIIEDIQVLQTKSPPAHGLAVFVIFPIPERLLRETPAQLEFHLDRIERETIFEKGSLQKTMEFVPISEGYGVNVFVVNVI